MQSLPRRVLRAAAALAVSTLATTPVGAQQVLVRRDVTTLTPQQVDALRRGVAAMKARPASDPTSWIYQANIHGTTDTPVRTAWNTCQHGSYFFLSWHRMYLYYLERILRKASGDPSLTLPYWNYSCPCSRSLPLAFRQPATAGNPLFEANRNATVNAGTALPVSAVASMVSLVPTNFSSPPGSGLSFGGQQAPGPVHFSGPHGRVESQPHDVVHVTIGGLMGNPNTAARDPIFYLHHANIDRLWSRWLQLGGGRANPPTSDTVWHGTKFTFFDENGTAVTLTGAQVVNTAAQLGYRYDDEGGPAAAPVPVIAIAGAAAAGERVAASAVETPVALRRAVVQVDVPVAPDARAKVAAATQPGRTRLVLAVEDIAYDASPGVYYEIYLNLPAGTAPDPQGAHFAGTLALFALAPHHGEPAAQGVRQDYDVTAVAQALQAAGAWPDDHVAVTFVPRGASEPKTAAAKTRADAAAETANARFGRVTLSTEPAR